MYITFIYLPLPYLPLVIEELALHCLAPQCCARANPEVATSLPRYAFVTASERNFPSICPVIVKETPFEVLREISLNLTQMVTWDSSMIRFYDQWSQNQL